MTYAQLFSAYEEQLLAVGEEAESLSFTFRGLKGLDLTSFVLLLRQEVTAEDQDLIEQIAKRLLAHEPAQYIIGRETFHGLTFKVDKRVLIPRPETQELVELILMQNAADRLSVLDIGTGSGAIAIALATSRKDWQVTASDPSQEALDLAQENASLNQTKVNFQHSDVFDNLSGRFDLIISNPPYIALEDKEEVGANVLASEPHMALFAQEEGMDIYRKIAQGAKDHLTDKGKIYLEIGYKQGQAIKVLFGKYLPDYQIQVLKDQFGQDRMVVISRD